MSCSFTPFSISVPPEITLEIFCNLHSLSEVLSFAATCQKMQEIWLQNAHIICWKVAPRSIECERHISRFLKHEASKPASTPEEARQLLRTSKIVQKALRELEVKIVNPLADKLQHRYESFYPDDTRPRHLTLSERPRFIRSYLKTWDLLRLPAESWDLKIASLTVRDQCLMFEMCRLPLNIGQEESPPFPKHGLYKCEGVRGQLERALLWQIDQFMMNQGLYHTSEKYPWARCNTGNGYGGFWFMWDHSQERCKEICHARTSPDLYKTLGQDTTHMWYDSSDEDI